MRDRMHLLLHIIVLFKRKHTSYISPSHDALLRKFRVTQFHENPEILAHVGMKKFSVLDSAYGALSNASKLIHIQSCS